MTTLEDITAAMRTRTADQQHFGHAVLFDFGDEGRLRVDGRAQGQAPIIDHEAAPADCTIAVSLADFVAIAQKKLNSQMAFMTGRLKVDGDLMVAMQLGGLLG